MIVRENKGFETRTDKPNENWTDDVDVFVVEDGAELAQKIIANSPYFDFVLDGEGNLIDITPTERPPEPTPEPTPIETLRLEQAQSNVEMIDLIMAMLGGV